MATTTPPIHLAMVNGQLRWRGDSCLGSALGRLLRRLLWHLVGRVVHRGFVAGHQNACPMET